MNSNSDWNHYDISSESDFEQSDMSSIPYWVSMEPIEFQINWQNTAGKRPIQPERERKFYEKLWKKQTNILYIDYDTSGENTHYSTKQSNMNDNIFKNPFSKMNFRSFGWDGPYGIQIPFFRIIKNDKEHFAQYHIKLKTPKYEYCSWFRFTKVKNIYEQIILCSNKFDFIYSKKSWKILSQKKSFFKNMTIQYLEMKSYLLERVLHDILFEIKSPKLLYLFSN